MWTKTTLQRSKGAPIIIQGNIVFPRQPVDAALVYEVLAELPRTRELSVACKWDAVTQLENSCMKQPPLLESLSLSVTTRAAAWYTTFTTFQDELFGGNAPRLQEVSLRMCALQPSSPIPSWVAPSTA